MISESTHASAPRPRLGAALAFSALLIAFAACGDEEAFSTGGSGNWNPTDASAGGDTSWGGSDDNFGDTAGPPPAENEVDFDLRTPEAGERHLFVPSVALDALIAVDAESLQVHLVEVGLAPTIVRALPGDGGAIVLNEGSSDVTLVRHNATPETSFSTRFFPVAAGATRLILSPDGAWAFAFYDERFGEGYARRGGYGSLQDVSAIRLEPGREAVFNLAVGYRPSAIQFTDDDALVLIECENGLSTIRLEDIDADTFLPPIQTTNDIFAPPLEREIVPGPDGTFVAVRDLQRKELLSVDLRNGARNRLELPDFPSDLDITPDGRHLLVPFVALKQVAIIDIPEAFTWTAPTPEVPEEVGENEDPPPPPANPHIRLIDMGAAFGSLALTADARHALLFTTQPGVAAIGMLDIEAATIGVQPMFKDIEAVAIDPRGAVAALMHRRNSGSGSVANQNAWSLLDLGTGYAKLVTVRNAVSMFTFTPDGTELFALVPDPAGAAHEVQRVDTDTFAIRTYGVPDRPTFVGALPRVSRMAISLDNPTGWITFIDTETNEVRQLNSFELNGLVR